MTKENKPTVVIDTNLLISSVIIKSNSLLHKLVTAWRKHSYRLVLSEEIVIEVENVLKREKIYRKYNILPEEIEEFISELRNSTDFVKPFDLDALPVHSRDVKDDKLLACALTGKCGYLITGDEDLLVLNGRAELGDLKIIKALEFLQKS